MNYILAINTTNPEKTAILLASFDCHPELDSGSKILKQVQDDVKIIAKKTWEAKANQSEELLPAIDKLLSKNKIITNKIGLIIVCIGPGSFTGTRVGVATANAMAFALNIPVLGIKTKNEEIEEITQKGFKLYRKGKVKKGIVARPFYDKKPNITTPKSK